MLDERLFHDPKGNHDPERYLHWHRMRLETLQGLHLAGYVELNFLFGWKYVESISALMEAGLLVTRMPINVYACYPVLPTVYSTAWLHHDTTYDLICALPGKAAKLKHMADTVLEASERNWFDRFYTDYLTAAQRKIVMHPTKGWVGMKQQMAASASLREQGYTMLSDVMELHDLSSTHLELAGLVVPHPTNLWFDKNQNLPSILGERYLFVSDLAEDLVVRKGKLKAMLRHIRRRPKAAAKGGLL